MVCISRIGAGQADSARFAGPQQRNPPSKPPLAVDNGRLGATGGPRDFHRGWEGRSVLLAFRNSGPTPLPPGGAESASARRLKRQGPVAGPCGRSSVGSRSFASQHGRASAVRSGVRAIDDRGLLDQRRVMHFSDFRSGPVRIFNVVAARQPDGFRLLYNELDDS